MSIPAYTPWSMGLDPQKMMSSESLVVSCTVSSAGSRPCAIQLPQRKGAPHAQPSQLLGVNSMYEPPVRSLNLNRSLNR